MNNLFITKGSKLSSNSIKKILFIVFISCMVIQVGGQTEKKDGYVVSYEGTELKTFYGECMHSAYYDRSTEERQSCGGKAPESAPLQVPKTITQTVMINDADGVLFNFDTAILTLYGNTVLTRFIHKIGKNNIVSINIDGYTDAIGTLEYNLKLSKERANSVRNFFVAHGFLADKIATHGYGERDIKVSRACLTKYPHSKPHLHSQLIKCTAADRKVIITIEHAQKVGKTSI